MATKGVTPFDQKVTGKDAPPPPDAVAPPPPPPVTVATTQQPPLGATHCAPPTVPSVTLSPVPVGSRDTGRGEPEVLALAPEDSEAVGDAVLEGVREGDAERLGV